MAASQSLIGLRGWIIDAPEPGAIRSWNDGALILDQGLVAEVGDYDTLSKKNREEPIRWLYGANHLLIPGLIDLHTHIPQYPAVARGEAELLPWLRQYIFPLEREFTGAKAKKECPDFFREAARNGTTTVAAYTAIFEDSCDAAFEAARDVGIRAVIGKMMMDIGSYGSLQPRKIASISLTESERLCGKWNGANDGLLEYAFSPRFAVGCSDKLMRGAAELAADKGARIQTHLSENKEEIEKVRHQFMWAKDYVDVYDQCGLLGERTLLGHCLHLGEREWNVLAEKGCAIAHCPTANLFLRSGLFPLNRAQARKIRVGLGSDVAAGAELNLFRVMRSAIETQAARRCYEPDANYVSIAAALYLATQGAAEALGKGGEIGSFEIGKEADLVVLDLGSLFPYERSEKIRSGLSAEDLLSLCIYRGGPQNIIETYVRGRSIHRAPDPGLFG